MSIVLLSTNFANAQSDSTLASDSIKMMLEQAMVDATRPPGARSLGVVTPVYNRQSGTAAPLGTIESVLRLNPAVDIRARGGFASQTDIHLRGGSADQSQIMLNGIDFTDARTGHQSHALPVDLESITAIDLIEDICGIGAYAGAINLKTITPTSDFLRIEGYGGSFGYAGASIGGGVLNEKGLSFAGNGSYRRSDGYRHNTDFDNVNAFARLTYRNEAAGTLDIQGGYQFRRFGSNGFYAAYNPDQWEQTSTGLASVRWIWTKGAFNMRAYASYRKNFDRYDWKRGTPMNHHNTDNVGAGIEAGYKSIAGTTTLGLDYKYHHIYSTNLGQELTSAHGIYTHADSRHIGNIWLSHAAQVQKVSLSACIGAGLTPYGHRFLWNVGVGYRPIASVLLEASAVQSTRLPTFTDLYYTSPAQINNLNLVPEDAITFRLSGKYNQGPWSAGVTTFYRMGRNIIDWVWHDEGEYKNKWHSEQTRKLGTFGVDVVGAYAPEMSVIERISFAYGYILTKRNKSVISKNAMDYMRNKAVAEVVLRFPYGFRLSLAGSVYDRAGNYTYYPVAGDASQNEIRSYRPYGLLDARFSWKWKLLELYVDGNNLTNTRYEDLGGLPLPGITIRAGVVINLTFPM